MRKMKIVKEIWKLPISFLDYMRRLYVESSVAILINTDVDVAAM